MKKNIISFSIVALFIFSTASSYSLSPCEVFKKFKNTLARYIPTAVTTAYQNHPLAAKTTIAIAVVTTAGVISYKYCPYIKSMVNNLIGLKINQKPQVVQSTQPKPKPAPTSTSTLQKPRPQQKDTTPLEEGRDEDGDDSKCGCVKPKPRPTTPNQTAPATGKEFYGEEAGE